MANFRPGYLQQGDPLGLTTGQQSITADNTVVPTAGFSLIQLSPNSATATARTITLVSGDAGYLGQQVITLENIAGSSYTLELANSGNCKLQAAWTPLQYDTITLLWDGSYWVEQGRSSANGVFPFALSSGKIVVGNSSNVAAAVDMSGAVAITNAGVTSIPLASGHVLVGSAGGAATDVAMSGAVAITNAGVTSIPLASAHILVGSAGGAATDVAMSGTVAITNAGVTSIPLTSAHILVGSGGGVAADVAMSGDATLANTGAVTIAPAIWKKTAAVTISQAQMLALSTPVQLVAAAGAGTVIVVDEIEILHTYSTAAYATGSDVSIEYATSGDDIVLIADTFFQAAASANTIIKPTAYDLDNSTGTGSGFAVTANANKDIQITASNFTNGNAANIFKIKTTYHVVTLMT